MKLEFGGNEIQNEFFASKVTITDSEVKMSPLGEYGTRRTSSESDLQLKLIMMLFMIQKF